MNDWRRQIASLLSAGVLLTASGCNSTKAAPSVPQPPSVQVTPVVAKEVRLTSEWVATLDGYVNAQIEPHVSGYLIRQNYMVPAKGPHTRRRMVGSGGCAEDRPAMSKRVTGGWIL